MAPPKTIEFAMADTVEMKPAPINGDWILEGRSVARFAPLSRSDDGFATTVVWDCTAGVFSWCYDIDETVYVLEGSVLIEDERGETRRISAGESAYFPAGSHAKWTVESYVRKVAFCRRPVPAGLETARKVAKAVYYGAQLRRPPAPVALGGGFA